MLCQKHRRHLEKENSTYTKEEQEVRMTTAVIWIQEPVRLDSGLTFDAKNVTRQRVVKEETKP